jgi:protein subunit release factor B
VTAADCRFDYTRGSGKGGQKRNKTSNAVRCTHLASGAVGYSESSRSQHQNKSEAFRKMAETETFKKWHRLEVARRLGQLTDIEERVDREMRNVKIECVEDDKWVLYKESS